MTGNMFDVKVYRGAELPIGADMCIKAKLYIAGWLLYPTLLSMCNRSCAPSSQIAVLLKNDVPVALVLYNGEILMAFTKEFERYQGHASKCVQALDLEPGSCAREGIAGTREFWRKNGVRVVPYYGH